MDDELLRKLAATGMPARSIAGEMSRSDTTIRKRAKELEIVISEAQKGPSPEAKGKHYR